MFNPDTTAASLAASLYMPSLETAARSLKVALITAPVHSDAEIEMAITALGREPGGGTTKGVYPVDAVGEQAAVSGKVRLRIGRRYVVSGGRRYDRRAMRQHECIPRDDKAASRLAPKGRDGRFDLFVAMNGRRDRF